MDTNNNLFLPIAVVAAGILIAGAVIWNGSRDPGTGGAGTAPTVDVAKVKTGNSPFLGRADAPVTMAVWSDFQCPFCKKFEVETLPSLVRDYVNEGKLKVVMMDFAFLGPDSLDAGVYNRAVWKLYPEQYATWRAKVYEAQDEEHGGFGDLKSLDALTKTVAGIDAAKVAADVAANRAAYEAAMAADRAEGQKLGINSTPSLVVGTQLVQGAYPYETFKAIIDAELAK